VRLLTPLIAQSMSAGKGCPKSWGTDTACTDRSGKGCHDPPLLRLNGISHKESFISNLQGDTQPEWQADCTNRSCHQLDGPPELGNAGFRAAMPSWPRRNIVHSAVQSVTAVN
jgi:hypothetical protein